MIHLAWISLYTLRFDQQVSSRKAEKISLTFLIAHMHCKKWIVSTLNLFDIKIQICFFFPFCLSSKFSIFRFLQHMPNYSLVQDLIFIHQSNCYYNIQIFVRLKFVVTALYPCHSYMYLEEEKCRLKISNIFV